MGKPAARLTDMTAHGGAVVGPGVPTVMIGKMPAATMGDQHVCPMITPGTPPIPHVGGPILLGSTGVFVGKKPAARVGDMAVCVGPPSQIVLGCFTVLIGEAGSGSQAGSAGAAAAAGTAKVGSVNKIKAIQFQKQETSPTEAYQILATVKDKGGRPIAGIRYQIEDPDGKILKGATSADGTIVHSGYTQKGAYTLRLVAFGEVKFSQNPVAIGKETWIAAQVDAEEGTTGTFFVSLVGSDGRRIFLDQVESRVSGKKLRSKWTISVDRWRSLFELDKRLSVTGVEVVARVDEALGVSKVFPLDLAYDLTVQDHQGHLLANQKIEISQSDGQLLQAKTDGSGKVKLNASSGSRSEFASHLEGRS